MSKLSYIAFFDVDETLINCKTMINYLKFFYMKTSNNRLIGYLRFIYFKIKLKYYQFIGKNRNYLNKYYYSNYIGFDMAFLLSISDEWFSEMMQTVSFNLLG